LICFVTLLECILIPFCLFFAQLKTVGSLKFSSKGVIAHVSKAPLQVTDEEFEINMGIIDALEELDDVDSIEHNMLN